MGQTIGGRVVQLGGGGGGADKTATLDRENGEASKGSRFIVSVVSLGCFSVTNGDRIR